MGRRFKFGDIFIDNDDLVSKDGYSKGNRRYVVSATPGKNNINIHIRVVKRKG